MQTYWSIIRSFNPDVRRYLLFNSAMTFAFMGNINVLVNLYLLRLGYDTVFIGQMVASGMLLWGVLALPAGMLGLRLGLKRVILISTLVLATGAFLLAAAGWLPELWRAPGLVAGWLVLWGGAALVTVNILPYVMAVASEESRSYVFSVQQALAAGVTLLGALISGNLPGLLAGWLGLPVDDPFPYQLTLLLGPVFYLAAAWTFIGAREINLTAQEGHQTKAQPAPLLPLLLLLLIVVTQAASDGATRTFFNVYLDTQLNVSVAQIGAIMGFAQVFPALLALVIPLIIQRLGARSTMLAGSSISIVFILLLALVPNSGAASLAFMGLASLAALMNTSRSIFSQMVVSPRWRTTSSAVITIGIAVGWALSAWQGGALIASLGFRGLFLLGGLLALLSSLFTLLDAYRAKQAETRPGDVPPTVPPPGTPPTGTPDPADGRAG